MSKLSDLLQLSAEARRRTGVEFTVGEILQQPALFRQIAGDLPADAAMVERIREIFADRTIVICGAGSSEFAGATVAPWLAQILRQRVVSVGTTDLVTHPHAIFAPAESYAVVSLARSGNSPESLAIFRWVQRHLPQVRQVVITCNAQGELAQAAAADAGALCILLPARCNDQSLVMTSSFTAMAFALAAIGLILSHDASAVPQLAEQLHKATTGLIEQSDLLQRLAGQTFSRVCCLGSGGLLGAAREIALKLTEMTDGQMVAVSNSFLGIRHGPRVFIDDDCLVIALLHPDSPVNRYELDFLRDLHLKQPERLLIIGGEEIATSFGEPANLLQQTFGAIARECTAAISAVLVGQILGLFCALARGLKPDAPSARGAIHRVVQGVTIYDDVV